MLTPAELGARLEDCGLCALLAGVRDSGLRQQSFLADRGSVDPGLGVALDLLCLGRTVERDAAASILGADAVALLLARGLAVAEDDRLRLDALRLVDHHGALVPVGLPGAHRNGYYGLDSVGLGRLLLDTQGRCLDLFASTGAQSLLMARTAEEVWSVEVDDGLAGPAAFGHELNGRADRIRPVWGDVLEVDLGGPYDVVSVNAPLLPTFGVTGLPRGADGGGDGHRLLAAALERVPLAPAGRLYATATCPGDDTGPDLRWLADLAGRRGLALSVLPTFVGRLDGAFGRELVRTLADSAAEPVPDLEARLRSRWARDGVDRVWFCLLSGRASVRAEVRMPTRQQNGRGWWI